MLVERALFNLRSLINHILIQIHQILCDILTILEVLLVYLIIILRSLKCSLLLRQLIG